MNRNEIIQSLLDTSYRKSYLEIGVANGDIFTEIKAEYKIGVDPISPSELVKASVNETCIYNMMTSDDFFAQIADTDYKFDVVFVDGLHEHEQAYRDIINSLKHLSSGGVIVVHDCTPMNEVMSLPPKMYTSVDKATRDGIGRGMWMGDVWKAVVQIRSFHRDLFVFTLDCDCGCAIITNGIPEFSLNYSLAEIKTMGFDDFIKNQDSLLNLKSYDYFYTFLKNTKYMRD